MQNYREADITEIQDLLLGRRIVAAEFGEFETTNRYGMPATAPGLITLDDGTHVYVLPNQGGCLCGSGDYALTSLATVNNVITAVRVTCEDGTPRRELEDVPRSYRIYVVADAVEINAVQIDGNDGNGYYGTGFELTVVPAESAA